MIYLDNAATTKMYDEALRVLTEANEKRWFNASALYKEASEESKTIRRARETLLGALKAGDGELYFLSGGTEADNTALFCTRKAKGSRVIVSESRKGAQRTGLRRDFRAHKKRRRRGRGKIRRFAHARRVACVRNARQQRNGSGQRHREIVRNDKARGSESGFSQRRRAGIRKNQSQPAFSRRGPLHGVGTQNPRTERYRRAVRRKGRPRQASRLRRRTGERLPFRDGKRTRD